MTRYVALLLISAVSLFSCKPAVYTPKPRGYYEILLPEHKYRSFTETSFPYSFEYPIYGNIIKDTSFYGKMPENPYWINIDFPELGGRIYISYKSITPGQSLEKLMEDSYEMSVAMHSKRADFIDDFNFHDTKNNVHGIFYNVGGDAASAYQFYATDSIKNFIRGALYFDVAPNADSLKPVNEFLRTDIEHMLRTLRWQ